MVRAVTGSVSWALPFGFVADFRGGGGQEEDGGNERGKKTRARGAGGAHVTFWTKLIFINRRRAPAFSVDKKNPFSVRI